MALPKSIDKSWCEKSDLTIYDASFWMVHESDPKQHSYRCECDAAFESNYIDYPNGEAAVFEKSQVLTSAVRAKLIATTKEVHNGMFVDISKTYVLKSDWIQWCRQNGYIELSNLFSNSCKAVQYTAIIEEIDSKESNIPTPDVKVPPVAQSKADSKPVTHKINRNSLDPAIDEAIKLAGNMELADVYLQLKEIALKATPPFTGVIHGKSLCYTNDNNSISEFRKDALGKRLRLRRDKAK